MPTTETNKNSIPICNVAPPVPQTGSDSQPKATSRNARRSGRKGYRCVATSPEGLVQQVAVSYLRHGYWFYVTGRIKSGKDPASLDTKLIAKYGIDINEREKTDRKRRGLANMQYIRHGNWFLLLATEGHHAFKQQERNQIRDCRRHPIRFEGYSISYRRSPITPKGGGEPKWHACVRIDGPTYKQLKSYFLDRAIHRTAKSLAQDFARVPFARYAPVRRQLLNILRSVNKARSKHRFDELLPNTIGLRRKIVKPFEHEVT
ncbi:hypothetical protein N9L06_00255 [Mariniblastus sp.]|nr:hypothetical protein [Mariniblastus sp.]